MTRGVFKRTEKHLENMRLSMLGKNSGKPAWNKGKKFNKETRKSDKLKEMCRQKALKQFENGMPDDTKRKLRVAHIKRIEEQYGMSPKSLCPSIGKNETYALNILESCFNYKILRQYRVNGYF